MIQTNVSCLNKQSLITCEALFDYLFNLGHVIAFVGAGGKSTLLYAMARRSAFLGERTLVTTSTHIFHPGEGVFCADVSACEKNWKAGTYAVLGTNLGNGKLGKPDDASLRQAMTSDRIFIEADGSKRLPCKAPADHEPQIPEETELVIGVIGLSALGRRLDECCFRAELAAGLLNTATDHILTPEDVVKLLSSPAGARKNTEGKAFFAVLNQSDQLPDADTGTRLLQLLKEKGIPAALTTFPESERI